MNEEIERNSQGNREDKAAPVERRRRFGRGIYDSKDVPIRLLDGFIAGIIAIIGIMILIFAVNGGYTVSFDAGESMTIPPQRLRYGQLAEEPETPVKPGYEFAGWYYETDEEHDWDFSVSKVGGDITLIARWEPTQITVKFDLNGGILEEGEDSIKVTYMQPYGNLPVLEKENSVFDGWVYSGKKITEDDTVVMPGEHVLTAAWK